MAMNGASIDQHVSGIVRSVNEKGLKLEGHENWLNVSRFANGVVLPERGQSVTCSLDKDGFLRAVTASDGAALPPVARAGDARPSATSQRERTITRLAVLKAAAEYAAGKQQSSSADVLKIAACWERWVTREDEPAPELDEAF